MKVRINKAKFDVTVCRSLFSHFIGLMFRFPKNDGLLFVFNKERDVALHMLFVFFPIDIIYFDKNKNVLKILRKIKPFTPYISSVRCRYIIEVIDCKNIKIGDRLRI